MTRSCASLSVVNENRFSSIIDNRESGCDGEDMALLNDEFADGMHPDLLGALGWRAVWLHVALTDAGEGLSPKDRDLITLVATSALGVDTRTAAVFLRRFGTTPQATLRRIRQLVAAGYLSLDQDETRVDLPLADLEWIRSRISGGQ